MKKKMEHTTYPNDTISYRRREREKMKKKGWEVETKKAVLFIIIIIH